MWTFNESFISCCVFHVSPGCKVAHLAAHSRRWPIEKAQTCALLEHHQQLVPLYGRRRLIFAVVMTGPLIRPPEIPKNNKTSLIVLSIS
jgi:hypothetical protein